MCEMCDCSSAQPLDLKNNVDSLKHLIQAVYKGSKP